MVNRIQGMTVENGGDTTKLSNALKKSAFVVMNAGTQNWKIIRHLLTMKPSLTDFGKNEPPYGE